KVYSKAYIANVYALARRTNSYASEVPSVSPLLPAPERLGGQRAAGAPGRVEAADAAHQDDGGEDLGHQARRHLRLEEAADHRQRGDPVGRRHTRPAADQAA